VLLRTSVNVRQRDLGQLPGKCADALESIGAGAAPRTAR
jgi:hypothetical protein